MARTIKRSDASTAIRSSKGVDGSPGREGREASAAGMSATPPRRGLPVVDPGFVTLNHEGFGWREWLVRLPKDAIADDLKEPDLWSQVQRHSVALRRHDHLYIVAFDESWAADAIVVDAGPRSAAISKPRLIRFESRTQRLFQDDTYRVKWFGDGYAVERRSDGMRVTAKVVNESLAERDLARLYPSPG